MSLPGSPTSNRGRLPQTLRPLLPAPSTVQDQPIASTASLLQGAAQLPRAEQPLRTEPEPEPVSTIPSALSQEEQSQISLDFDPLPAGIDLNFDRPYYGSDSHTSTTPAPIPSPQPVDPALSSTENCLSDQPRGLTLRHYLDREPCPFTGYDRIAAQAVTEAQTSTTPSTVVNPPGQAAYPAQPPAPFSHGYTYPPPPTPGAPILPIPSRGQTRKRKVNQIAESTGSDKPNKKRNTARSATSFKTPDTPRPQTTAPPSGVTQTQSLGYLPFPTSDNRKRLASELDGNTIPCPATKKRSLQHPNEQSNEKPKFSVDIPRRFLIEALARVNQDSPFIRSLVLDCFDRAKSANKPCSYQNAPIRQQPTEQQASTDQASVGQASNKKNSNKKGGKRAGANKGSTMQAPVEKISAGQMPTEQPTQPYAMSAGNPAGYPSQGFVSAGQPLVNPHRDLEALGEFSDSDVARKLKFGSVMISRAGLGVPRGLSAPETVRRLTSIQEELARQQDVGPVLPPSELSPQVPKGFTPKPYHVPDDIDDHRVHAFFAKKNKDLCTRNKQVDLERNNMAAKGTRQRREESLSQYRNISKDLTIQLNWWRIKAASLGANLNEWDELEGHTLNAFNRDMDERMKRLEEEASKEAKKQKAKAQAAITSQNNKLAKQDAQRQNKEIKQVVSAYAAEDHAAIERMANADYDAKATAYRKPRAKQTSKKARKATNVDEDKESDAGVETPEVETPTANATEDVAGDPGNAENADSNMFGLDDVARANTEFAPPNTSMASQSVYASVEDAQPSNNFTFNPVPNFDSNVQTQGDQPSDAEELGDIEHNDLRRMPSNVTMFDAPTDGTHIATSMAPPPLMPTMMDQSAVWAPPPSFDASTLPPNQFNPHLDGPMGDMNIPPADMHAPVNDMSMVPANNMDFNMHNPMNDLGTLPPYMNPSFQGPMNGIDEPSPQNLDQPWFNPTNNAESNTFTPTLPVISQSIEHPQQTTTNNTGTSDTFDHNADPSTFPDPYEEAFFGNYLGDMNSSQN
ncbi:uncharacterized protein B0J16DRAFT_383120 [Fusarium flagelliforme]|uniref:Uncharacterized protein n=1 Tax=Fusarium flagelliforme TaxID=2675880 RepID=A0A395MN75_9HYPO|nr:uncharacterized protein B0J16DRAFT_383120 [Fusarium flagelliforme]KAH7189252.1 hypothetical protein B0J16DRAFT_383120 [Fusarium flagelliforme]RFN49270.1 hypothetical protein FIE12Z_6491 [Fusarium flagelliforme]